MSKSTTPPPPSPDHGRPAKPYLEFPLFPHKTKRWAKKIKGKTVYFGPWNDWRAALKAYEAFIVSGPITVTEARTKYVAYLESLLASEEVTSRHVNAVWWTLKRFEKIVGGTKLIGNLGASDYSRWRVELGKTNKAMALGNHVRKVRAFLKWCDDQGIIKGGVPRYDGLKRPTTEQLRRARKASGPKFFEAEEIRKLLAHATPTMKAAIYLGINCGLDDEAIAQFKTGHIKGNWLDEPREKTGVERRSRLWPETIEALAAIIKPGDEIVFRTSTGRSFVARDMAGTGNPIKQMFRDLCKGTCVYKKWRGFSALRKTCQTIGEESGDVPVMDMVLGHEKGNMADAYMQRMLGRRLFRVAKYIRAWLLGKKRIGTPEGHYSIFCHSHGLTTDSNRRLALMGSRWRSPVHPTRNGPWAAGPAWGRRRR